MNYALGVKHELSPHFEQVVLSATGASGMRVEEVIQELWSGYGAIVRIRLEGKDGGPSTVVAKHVRMPGGESGSHPRGWNTDASHARKVRSYEVETAFYREWSERCGNACRVPRLLGFGEEGAEVLLVMEDLDASGFSGRRQNVTWEELKACLGWLANFHATFLGVEPAGLWETGTYWHLGTRSEELEALDDAALKASAAAIDKKLSGARFQTLVHGDAKIANFCFSESSGEVAAVDFQYVGGGCGMKDVAYFAGSCLDEAACEEREEEILGVYFGALRGALNELQPAADQDALEAEWRELYPMAWTDFHRFLKGWSPGHWKINSYSERVAREVVEELGAGI